MNNFKKVSAFATALLMSALAVNPAVYAEDAASYDMSVKVNVGDKGKAISPYIFGINEHGLEKGLQVNSIRQGGNRYTGYNWENNASNAGSDWKHSSDNNLSSNSKPADCAQSLSKKATKNNISYKLATAQMAGYVSADKDGTVSEAEAAPSKRWNEVIAKKGSEFAAEPDLTDGKVYIDEYVNYVKNAIGDSTTATGIQGWSLDNEPGLWQHTHPRIHGDIVTADELIKKSIDTASAIKGVDKNAEIFGPALFGYTAFVQLQDEADWKKINADGKYRWFIDYYLEQMKAEEAKSGQRLLDVLDIHYYSEAKCPDCDTRICMSADHPAEHTKGIDELTQSYRTLIEKDYAENSWIGEWCQSNIPILTNVKESIDKYYPGTKLAVTEYDFGGGQTVAGAIAEVDALGTFAENDVYFATLWADDVPYQYSAINLFTNYDGEGSAFGNTLIESKTDDYIKSTSYASVQDGEQGKVSVIITNKDQKKAENAVIDLSSAKTDYKNAAVYILSGETSEIIHKTSLKDIKNNKLTVEIPPLAIAEVVVSDNEADYKEVVEKVQPTYEYVDGKVTAGKDAGAFSYSFDEAIAGNTIVLDVEVKNSPKAMGCAADFNVKYDGKDYWVSYNWEASASGKVEVNISGAPANASCVTDDTPVEDEALLEKLGEEVLKSTAKTAAFQTWYVADAAWEDQDHSLVTLKGVQLKKKSSAPSAPVMAEFEGTVKAAAKAGDYAVSFSEPIDGGKIVLDVDVKSGVVSAMGCIDFNVKYDGKDWWVHYNWEAKKSGEVTIDLKEPTGALDVTVEGNEEETDEDILAAIAEAIMKSAPKTTNFQTWWMADSSWEEDTDHSKVTLKGAKLVKESSAPVTTPTVQPSEPSVTPTEEPGTTVEKYSAGDVNGDGMVDLTDLSVLSLFLIGDTKLGDAAQKAADVDADGNVHLTDLATLRQYLSKVPGIVLGK